MGMAVLQAETDQGLAAVESAVAGFCDGFDPGVVTAAVAAEVVRRLAVVKRRIEAAEAFAAGAVSVAAVREIAGAVAVDPTAEARLLAVATRGDHRVLVDRAAQVRQQARSGQDETARHAPGCERDGSCGPTPTATVW
jgi:hypothetical protein